MKSIYTIMFFVPPILLFTGCDREPIPVSNEIQLKLKMPKALEKKGQAYQEFLKRADYLEVVAESRETILYRGSFSPDQWKNLSLPELGFPRSPKDTLTVEVRFWNRNKEGLKNLDPILSGKKKLAAGDLHPGRPLIVEITLQLNGNLPE